MAVYLRTVLYCESHMRVVLQRVTSASVTVAGERIAAIGPGLLCLCGISREDTREDRDWCAAKLLSVRLWANEATGKPWAVSAAKKGLEVLLVSQFTLHAVLKGNKPDFHKSMAPAEAEPFFNAFVAAVRAKHTSADKVQAGKFGAKMQVELVNDGPVTLCLDSDHAGFKKQQLLKQQKLNHVQTGAGAAAADGAGPGGMSKKQAKRLAKRQAKKLTAEVEDEKSSPTTAASAAAAAAPAAAASPPPKDTNSHTNSNSQQKR